MKNLKKVLLILACSSLLIGCSAGEQGPKGEQGIPGEQGPKGSDGNDGKSAYEIAKQNGFVGTEAEWLASLKGQNGGKGDTGPAGKSAYEIAKANGYTGTESEWIASLKGQNGGSGKSAFEIAVEGGYTGTQAQWMESLKGEDGKTAYQLYVDSVKEGETPLTQSQWIASLSGANGKSAYQIYCENNPEYEGTEQDWINEFFSKDETDYSQYGNFEFEHTVFNGVKGYVASFIGEDEEIIVPSTFDGLPILGLKIGYVSLVSGYESASDIEIEKIELPSSVQFLSINRYIDYKIEIKNVYYKDTLTNLNKTELLNVLPFSNFFTFEQDKYEKKITNYDAILDAKNSIKDDLDTIFANNVLFGDSEKEINLDQIRLTLNEKNYDLDISFDVDNDLPCSIVNNKIIYKASELENCGYKDCAIKTSLTSGIFKYTLDDYSFSLSKYPNRVYVDNVMFPVSGSNGDSKYQEIYLEGGIHNIACSYQDVENYPTKIPAFIRDENGPVSDLVFNPVAKTVSNEQTSTYYLTFNVKTGLVSTSQDDTVEKVAAFKIFKVLNDMLFAFGSNRAVVYENETVDVPTTLSFTYQNTAYEASVLVSASDPEYLSVNNNVITFDLQGSKEPQSDSVYLRVLSTSPYFVTTLIYHFTILPN